MVGSLPLPGSLNKLEEFLQKGLITTGETLQKQLTLYPAQVLSKLLPKQILPYNALQSGPLAFEARTDLSPNVGLRVRVLVLKASDLRKAVFGSLNLLSCPSEHDSHEIPADGWLRLLWGPDGNP